MQILKASLKNKALIFIGVWFLLCALVLASTVVKINTNLKLASFDAVISISITAVPLLFLFLLQNYLPNFLNKLTTQIALTAALLIKAVYLQKLILPFVYDHYNQTNFEDLLKQTEILRLFIVFLQSVFFFATMWLLNFIKNNIKQQTYKQQAELTLRDAELIKLRQQLQPHFLFNSLNSINALVVSQPQVARKMIQNLSDFLRGTLKKDENKLVSLEEELKLLQLYLDIEKIRFGHRLILEFKVNDESKSLKLPALILQPIVENAIKFGLYNVLNDVTISIQTKIDTSNLIIEVKNPFEDDALQIRKGEGFGLSLIERRLQLVYHRSDLLAIEKSNNVFITTLIIPQHD